MEVTKSVLSRVPENYIRRQTLVNAERFVTEELRAFESKVLSATDRRNQLEYELFAQLRQHVAAQAERLRHTATLIGTIDALVSLAALAVKNGWIRPDVNDEYELVIEEGRHPVLDTRSAQFVPNDLRLDTSQHVLMLTGPNAAGKSTYARQAALLVLLAQMGSFIPARTARVGVVDRIFTRVGAADFLAQGLSTFMVEMMETANILNHATQRSLVILDEVGRGPEQRMAALLRRRLPKSLRHRYEPRPCLPPIIMSSGRSQTRCPELLTPGLRSARSRMR